MILNHQGWKPATWSPVGIRHETQGAASEKPGAKHSAAPGIGFHHPPQPQRGGSETCNFDDINRLTISQTT
jgi:hypothetical protein